MSSVHPTHDLHLFLRTKQLLKGEKKKRREVSRVGATHLFFMRKLSRKLIYVNAKMRENIKFSCIAKIFKFRKIISIPTLVQLLSFSAITFLRENSSPWENSSSWENTPPCLSPPPPVRNVCFSSNDCSGKSASCMQDRQLLRLEVLYNINLKILAGQ